MIPEPPGGSIAEIVAWAKDNPGAFPELVRTMNALQNIVVRLVSPAGPASAGTKAVGSQQNIIITVPIQFSATIVAPSGGSTVDAQCRATLTQLINALSQTGQNPA